MPRVLQVLPHRGGGAETYIDLLEGGRYQHERVALSTSRSPLAAAPSIALGVPRVARRARSFDVVQSHGDVASMLALPALRSRPSVWAPAGLHLLRRAEGARARLVHAGLRRVVAATGRTLCQSQAEVDDLTAVAAPADRHKLVIVDNGVRLPDWPDDDQRAAARASLGLADDAVVALYLGQLEPRKDPLTAIAAAERVDALVLLVAGDGPLRADAEGHASEHVRVLGHADAEPLLRAADVFVMPSQREGQSIAVLEAMAHGLAMVVSDGPGNPEAVGDAGMVVPVGDVDAWAAQLTRLAGDPDERARMQEAARERAVERFSVERFRRDIEAIYDELLAL
ncbi:MAG TPA: glycosyltransferase family 4 protein [Thermoleophilaceae bacterium]